MQKFYIFIVSLFLSLILLFVAAFIYLDKQRHGTYYYSVTLEGYDVGTIKIDRYDTEDKLLYRSISAIPFYPSFADSKSKIVLTKKYRLENYSKENSGNGAIENILLENRQNNIAFVYISRSQFAALSNIPVKDPTYVFEEDSPVTYLPIIENYDFKRGRSQGFNTINPSSAFLPPIRRFVTLTSVRNEYLKIGSKNIKTECLLFKTKGYPQGTLWVSKSDRSLIKIEFPTLHLKITRTFRPKSIIAKEYIPKGDGYLSKDIAFKNENIELSGTFLVPKRDGKFPGILLVGGDGPEDRLCGGLFASLADGLAKNGFSVFYFDKRGIGASSGRWSSTTNKDNIEDVKAALECLKSQAQIDPDRVYIIAHSKGAYYAAKIASARNDIRGLVLLTPLSTSIHTYSIDIDKLKEMALKLKWSDEYLKLVLQSREETINKIQASAHNWFSLLRKRHLLAKMREELNEKPADVFKSLKTPVLIVQGKDEIFSGLETASLIDTALAEGGNNDHMLVYFSYLGAFLGTKISDDIHKIHYEVDTAVAKTVTDWLSARTAATTPTP